MQPNNVPMVNGLTPQTRGDQLWAPEVSEIYMSGKVPKLLPFMEKRLAVTEGMQSLADTQGSWNIPQMKQLARLWHTQDESQRSIILRYFVIWIDSQITSIGNGYLKYFTGSETLSPDYWPLQWGTVCGIEMWCISQTKGRDKYANLIRLCQQYHTIAMKLCIALSHTDNDKIYVSPLGERTSQWSDGNLNAVVEVFSGINSSRRALNRSTYTRGIDWPVRWARAVEHPSQKDIDSARYPLLWSEIRRLEWVDGTVLTYKPTQQNHNTNSYVYELWESDQRTLYYPWPDGRAFGVLGMQETRIEGNLLITEWEYHTTNSEGIEEIHSGENTLTLPTVPFAKGKCFVLGSNGRQEID